MSATRSSPAVPSRPCTCSTVSLPERTRATDRAATARRASSPPARRATSSSASSSASRPSLPTISWSRSMIWLVPDAGEVEALAARQDGDRDLVRLGRREDELHVRRRLLQRLEQGVERLRRQHVNFVDDVDLVARSAAGETARWPGSRGSRRCRGCSAPSISRTSTSSPDDDGPADVALVARRRGRPLHAVEALARMRAVLVLPTPRAPVNR